MEPLFWGALVLIAVLGIFSRFGKPEPQRIAGKTADESTFDPESVSGSVDGIESIAIAGAIGHSPYR